MSSASAPVLQVRENVALQAAVTHKRPHAIHEKIRRDAEKDLYDELVRELSSCDGIKLKECGKKFPTKAHKLEAAIEYIRSRQDKDKRTEAEARKYRREIRILRLQIRRLSGFAEEVEWDEHELEAGDSESSENF